MTDPKAPLPDEVEKIAKDMFQWVDSVNATFIVDLAKKYRG